MRRFAYYPSKMRVGMPHNFRFATVAAKGGNPQQSRMAASRTSFKDWSGVAAKFHGPMRFGGQLDDLLHSWR